MLNLILQFSAEELNEALFEATPEEKLTKKQPIQLFVDSTEDYSNQEAKAFVKEALDRGTLIAYKSVVSFFTNEKPSEITGLLAENVDLEKGLIFIRTRMVRNNTNHSYEETAPKGGKF